MAISYPLDLPTQTGIASIRLVARNVVSTSTSPFTFKQQVVKHSGERWEADIALPPQKRDDAEEWLGFLLSLGGAYGTFLLGDPLGDTPRGSAASVPGTPSVNGDGQTGNLLAIDGLPVSATGYLKAGDYIQIGTGASSRLHKVLQQVDTNSSGQATLAIWPSLRESPVNNATVIVSDCKGLFRLSAADTSWDINTASIYGMTFGAVEAI
jgi:hypothetical protein